MKRIGATKDYFFSEDYFRGLMGSGDIGMNLFVCRLDSNVIAGGLFSVCGDVAQYHLGGTANDFLSLAPTKLMFDVVRRWAKNQNCTRFHLGGGVGGREDSLFSFKRGFSNLEYPFIVWKYVVDDAMYSELSIARQSQLSPDASEKLDEAFFPAYRAPLRMGLQER